MKNLLARKPKKSIKSGHIYKLGEHFLACGDATDQQLIQRLVQGHKIDLMLTDPPYGVAYVESKKGLTSQSKNHKVIKNDHIQSEKGYQVFTSNWLKVISLHLAEYNSYYIFNSDRMIFSLKDGLTQEGFKMSQLLIWMKNQAVMGRLDYLPIHELIAYGWKGKHKFRKSKDKTALFYPKPQKSKLHPTMKPVGLLRRLILNSSNTGDIIYDPFGGSGSTLIACEQTKRKCLMVELDSEYCQKILDRFEKITGIKPILLTN